MVELVNPRAIFGSEHFAARSRPAFDMAQIQQRAHLIVIANWNYPGRNNLAHVVPNDVALMTAALRRKFLNALVVAPPIQNTTMDSMANIRNQLQNAAQGVQNGDAVIIYVAGHGLTAGGGSVLIPIDFQSDFQPAYPNPEQWAQHARLKEFLTVFQQRNQDGVNHVIWNICRAPFQALTLPNMEIPGYNYFIMFACADTQLSYIGNNMADVNGDGQPHVQVSNLPKAYDEALQHEPDLRSLSDSVREKVFWMRQAPLTPQIVQVLDTLMPPAQGGAFGFWSLIASWMWGNLVRPVVHAGLDAVQQGANNVVQQGHRAVDAFGFPLRTPENGIYIIKPQSGINERRFLSCTDSGHVDLWHEVDRSGRQVWRVTTGHRVFSTVEVFAGTGDRRYLSCTSGGETVELWTHDDASGRQRWKFQPNSNGSWKIEVLGGVNGNRKYLSCTHDGTKCDLWHEDDDSGRQQWILEPAK